MKSTHFRAITIDIMLLKSTLRRDGLQKTFAVFGGFFYVQNTNNILNFFYPVLINNLIAWYFVATVITIHFDH
jgi:hypothetical protein